MGGSPKPPKISDVERKAQQQQLRLMREQMEAADRPVSIPKIPKPIPPPPPPTESSADIEAAMDDQRRKAAKRRNSGSGTLFAGETGGYRGTQTLLG